MSEQTRRTGGVHRRVLGLRPRMLAALVFTSAVTLAVAALLVFSPLERRLRANAQSAVTSALQSTISQFATVGVDPATGRPDELELAAVAGVLRRRSGAQVTILDSKLTTVYSPLRLDLDVPDYYSEARAALSSGKVVHARLGEQLILAAPVRIGEARGRDVVVLVRRMEYVSSVVGVVRRAFLEATAVGLLIAVLLGLGLTTTLLRRLERLRAAARELEQRGLDAPVPVDERHDEIGDLSRAFTSMQARLRHQEAARRAFVATASHELRTPLASLQGTLELLADDLSDTQPDLEDARGRTESAREQSRRLSTLASDLLDLSRLDAEVALRAEPVELGEMCRAVAAEFEQRAAAGEVRLQTGSPDGPCWAQGDPGAVARIVSILLDNAIGIAPGGTTVTVRPSSSEAWTEVTVSDRGPGVPRQERERIFERFQRGSAAAGRHGFGLGLAIGRELAQRMGGTLALQEPTETERGASFQLRLPLAPADANGEQE